MKLNKPILYFTIFSLLITTFFTNIYAESTENTSAGQATAAEFVNHAEEGKKLNIKSECCILIDGRTGDVIYEKKADQKMYPASITKILTTYLACEYGKFDETVTFSTNAITNIGPDSSNMGARIGEKINFLDCLYGIMLNSANETCMAVAEHISGTVDNFVDKMNTKAAEIGCMNTHFANPHGFHDPNHYTTARDMALIAKLAITNETFRTIWGTENHVIQATNTCAIRDMYNTNQLINPDSPFYYPLCRGGKTGFHDDAGNTLVSYAVKDDIQLISVVLKDLGKENAYSDARTLLDYGFNQFETKTVFTADGFSSQIPVEQNYNGHKFDLGKADITASGDLSASLVKFADISQITWEAEGLSEVIEAPAQIGTVVGKINIFYKGEYLGNVDAVISSNVAAKSTQELDKQIKIEYFKSLVQTSAKYVAAGVLLVFLLLVIIRMITRSGREKRKEKQLAEGKRRKKKSKQKIKIKF